VHTYLANQNQPYVYGDYPIFTAEVASTFNEMLLMRYLLDHTTEPDRKLYLLDYYITQVNDTVVRQVMFAEFEYLIHRAGEQGETLTADMLGETYQEILTKYWGPLVAFDPERSPLSWARIPHFYYNYYVYQYATAYAATATLSQRVLAGDQEARTSYLDCLRSGNSRYPVETLRLAGVDMTTPEPVRDVFALLTALLDELEELLTGKDQ
jgi:oligoendopeptidase F